MAELDRQTAIARLRQLAVATARLRSGQPVSLREDNGACWRVVSVERLDRTSLSDMRKREGTLMAITATRAATLHIPPTGDDVIQLPLRDDMNTRLVQALADPTHDLDMSFRGPFDRIMAAAPVPVKAAVRLAKIAKLLPAVLVTPVDGSDDALPVNDIMTYGALEAASLQRVVSAHVPLADMEHSRIVAFRAGDDSAEHLAIVLGEPKSDAPVLIRLHSECFTGDLLGSLKCDCGEQLRGALRAIAEEGNGILLYLAQEGRGIGLLNKLRAYRLQDDGFDTVEANERLGFDADEREFSVAAEMLRQLGVQQVRLLTNNPDKVSGLQALGIDVVERVAHAFPPNNHNERYLATKARRSGHYLDPNAKASKDKS